MPADNTTELKKLNDLLGSLVRLGQLAEVSHREILAALQNALRENWAKAYRQALEDLDLGDAPTAKAVGF